MKNTKMCPKCGGNELIRVDLDPIRYQMNMIPIRLGGLVSVPVARYVCCACGYSEEWIDKEDIPKLREKYPRVF